MHRILSVRSDGHNGGCHPGIGLFGNAHDRFADRCLRFPHFMDYDGFPMEPFPVHALYFVSGDLGNYVCGTCGVLYCGEETYKKDFRGLSGGLHEEI